ncbi:MAG TPA: glycosyltransferase [Candidatus Limnocylindria bacterium]|nr:glycosyltransferase [Candidatus Limnocylindria bacterium]
MAPEHLVCFSHLRWDFVYQRPQHLMSRAARDARVVLIEEREVREGAEPGVAVTTSREGVRVCRPIVPSGRTGADADRLEKRLVSELLAREGVRSPIVWHYSPMAEPLSRDIDASAVIYDCMDDLAAFRFAPPGLRALERRLLHRADLVFTGGQSLYRAKRSQHSSVHAFPSGVDVPHFAQARSTPRLPIPSDLTMTRPILLYVGVLDERIDMGLIEAVAARRPDWSVVLVGPVVKVDVSDLPRQPNVYWLGMKQYAELPSYLAHADVAIMPFALNEATRYISPTKTPEYLAAGLSVVSTPIVDVVQPYGNLGLVRIADDPKGFVEACEAGMRTRPPHRAVQAVLARASWDHVWDGMASRIQEVLDSRRRPGAVPAIEARG